MFHKKAGSAGYDLGLHLNSTFCPYDIFISQQLFKYNSRQIGYGIRAYTLRIQIRKHVLQNTVVRYTNIFS